ncbi:MAG: sigma-70 family RNA polymerase sigma factor [Clostridia bacterium]|nr:sigma-70 family RNA polymerase sigma factor [Clostridia bacterium]
MDTEEKTPLNENADENDRLLARYQDGDDSAQDELCARNTGLVKSAARRFTGRGTDFEDLVQIGMLGLIKAIRSFDRSRNTVFSTYAVPLIIGEIKRFLRDDGMIKVSREVRRQGTALLRARENYLNEHTSEPKLSELASICGMSVEDAAFALDAVCPVYSLSDSPRGDELTYEQTVASPEDEIDLATDKLALRDVLTKLDGLSKKIVECRFFRDMSQQETANALGITQVKVSRQEKKILLFLRDKLT